MLTGRAVRVLSQIFGKNDTHVPPEGRDLIRKTLHDKGVLFSFYEVAWAQRRFSILTCLGRGSRRVWSLTRVQ